MNSNDKHDANRQRKLGRIDTYYVHFGEFDILLKPDRESEVPAAFLLSIKGPGLPTLTIDKSGATVEDPDTFGCKEGHGQISFTEKLSLPFPYSKLSSND